MTGGITTTYSDIFVHRIASLCEERHISYNKLAEMSGVGQSTIDNIIHGHSKNPKTQTLHRIATAFNMTLAEFMDFPELNSYSFEDETP